MVASRYTRPIQFCHGVASSYSSSIVTMAVSRTVFVIKRDIGRKTSISHTHLVFNLHDPIETLLILSKILIQTVRVPELLGGAKYCRKVQACA